MATIEILIIPFLEISISCLLIAFFFWYYLLVYYWKVLFYLRKSKSKRFSEVIQSKKWFGLYPFLNPIGAANRLMKYIESDLDTDDKRMRDYKRKFTQVSKITIILLIVFIVFFMSAITIAIIIGRNQ